MGLVSTTRLIYGKLYGGGPGPAGVDRPLAIKRGLEHELTISDYAYLELAEACIILVDSLPEALNNLKGGLMATF